MDKYEIDLMIRQGCYYLDTNQHDALRAVWHPDTRRTSIRTSSSEGTVDDWIHSCKQQSNLKPGPGSGPFHTIQPVEIIIRDNRALATSIMSMHLRFPYKDCIFELESWSHLQ